MTMPTKLTLELFRAEINARLAKLYDDRIPLAAEIDESYEVLLRELKTLILRGGKRLRPYLCYLAYIGLGGDKVPEILELVSSQELIHNFLLIHDDVFDKDTIRYGDLNISGRYEKDILPDMSNEAKKHLAAAVAVMGGTITYSFALSTILESDFPDETKIIALKRTQRMIFEICGGEMLDLVTPTFKDEDITQELLLNICVYKTASYSFEYPMQMGAIMANADEKTLKNISEFANHIGIAFQLTDDLLGSFGDEEELGKSVLSDLREGKKTILFSKCLELSSDNDRRQITGIIGDPNASFDDLIKVREILVRSGARDYVRDLAQVQIDEALLLIPKIGFTTEVEDEIRLICEFSIKRHL
jgi:geranylgeranyl pyrophosphate synthase